VACPDQVPRVEVRLDAPQTLVGVLAEQARAVTARLGEGDLRAAELNSVVSLSRASRFM